MLEVPLLSVCYAVALYAVELQDYMSEIKHTPLTQHLPHRSSYKLAFTRRLRGSRLDAGPLVRYPHQVTVYQLVTPLWSIHS